MPAFALSSHGKHLGRYDVVGVHASSPDRFIQHVALHIAEGREVTHGQEVDVAHMGPPLDTSGKAHAHAVGQAPLSSTEIATVEVWIAKIEDEYLHAGAGRRKQYIVHPPWKDVRDPNRNVRRYRRYSCAGFVLDAYRQVEIYLLEIEETSLPKVDEAMLRSAYPGIGSRLTQNLGIDGDGPWRIVLAGSVHSLNRSSEAIRTEPYQARPGDERFPPRISP
jgi:hypothetical protein